MKHFRDDYQRRIVDLENKIPDDEPVCLLRAQDEYAADALDRYVDLVRDDFRVSRAMVARMEMMLYVFHHWPKKKFPDAPEPVDKDA